MVYLNKKELMPYIDGNYKTNQYKHFAGDSLGGISAINCMLTQPDMFNDYIAISLPSFSGTMSIFENLQKKKLKKGTTINKKKKYCNGNEGGINSFINKGLLKFDSIIKEKI